MQLLIILAAVLTSSLAADTAQNSEEDLQRYNVTVLWFCLVLIALQCAKIEGEGLYNFIS